MRATTVLRRAASLFLATAVTSGLALVGSAPASAAAVTFMVNSLADTSDANPGNGTCATAGAVCTLRAAIEEANAGSAANTYTVTFSVAGTMQEGATALPNINRAVTVDGSTAPGYVAATGPTFVVACDGSAASSNNGIGVTAANVTIRAVGVVNCSTAIITSSGATGLKVVGTYLGSDGNTFAAGRAVRAGVTVNGASSTVGGTTAADRNVISGYLVVGVAVADGVTGAVVQGNYLGPDRTGTTSLQNPASQPGDGTDPATMAVWGQGAGTTISSNLISGNAGTGIFISKGSATITGNTIGPDATGTQALGNGSTGILAIAGTTTTIGGPGAGEGNLIAAWRKAPTSASTFTNLVRIIGATSTIQGNKIGSNAAGTASLCTATGSNNEAVSIEPSTGGVGSNVTLGGTAAGAGNLISGCTTGVHIGAVSTETGSSTVVIQGNRIGTNAAGTAGLVVPGAAQVGHAGVLVKAGHKVTIGGTAAGAGNVISGHVTGIYAEDDDSGLLIQGNRIGTNAAGTAAIPNGHDGLDIIDTKAAVLGSGGHAVIGGTTAAAANVISGNANTGLLMARPGTVQGNLIGTNAAGTAAIPNGGASGVTLNHAGIAFGGSAAGAGNVVSGNAHAGLLIASAQVPTIQGNRIGTNAAGSAAVPNGGSGIFVGGATTSGAIGGAGAGQGNLISGNTVDGVQIIGGSGVDVRGNLIHANTGLNIDLFQHGESINVGNHDQIHPTLTTAVVGASTTSVGGTVTSDRTGTIIVDVYAGSSCQAAYGAGQAQQYLGSLSVPYPVAGAATAFSGQVAKATVGSVITATSTIAGNGTSQLSTCSTYTDIDLTAKDTFASAPIGSDVATEITVTNHGPATATGVGIDLSAPTGPQAASDTTSIDVPNAGSVDSGTSVWTIPTLAPGASASVCIRGDIARASYPFEVSPGVSFDVPVSWSPEGTLDTASGVVDPYTGNNRTSGNTQVGTVASGAAVCALPTLSIDDASLTRPASGTAPMTFTVHLSKVQTRSVTVHYATVNGKAVAVEDYVATSGTLTFAAGQTTRTVTVPVVGNQSDEPDKAFTVVLSAPTHATLGDSSATGTVLANHLLAGCPPGSSGNQRFVCHLYFDALGRAPESGGFTYWVNKLNKGTARSTMAKSYLTQPESLRKVADRAYVLYLGRHGTTGELSGWATKLANKTATTQDIRIAVLASAEYFTRVGGTNDAFVKQLFFDVFRRNVDASGLAYWKGQLTAGKTRTNVATRFMAEPEGRRKIVGDIYLRFLRRDPTTNEANGWVSQLAAGKTEVDVGIGLVASTEYFNRPQD